MSIETLVGIIVITTFVGVIFYCIKGHNLMIGFTVVSILWTIIALVANQLSPNPAIAGMPVLDVVAKVFQEGPELYAKAMLVNVFFGAFFSRVLMDTGIAATLIRKVVELGGDKPRLTMTLLCVVTALCFTSMTGIGPVMSIAVIVLPILQALGIPAPIALFSFMGSIMAGVIANITHFIQYRGILGGMEPGIIEGYSYEEYFTFGMIGLAIALVVVLLVTNLALNKTKTAHAWASSATGSAVVDAPFYSWISVLLPVLLVVVLKIPLIVSFVVSSLYALITCGKLKGGFTEICRIISKLFSDGATDVGPMVGFLLTLSMFNAAAVYIAPYFDAVIGGLFPTSALGICALFAVLIPLGFFRGPTNLVGCGTAIASVVLSLQAWPFAFIYPLFSIATCVPQHIDITQSWVAWGLGYTKVNQKDLMKMTIPTGWIAGAILCFVIYFLYGGLV